MAFAPLFRRVASGEVSPADAAALVDATVALVQRTPLPRPFDNAPAYPVAPSVRQRP